MTTARRSLYALCVVAQNKPLPGNLNQNSSVAEIVAWLDQTTFRHAGIRLKDSWEDDDSTYCPPWSTVMETTPTLAINEHRVHL
jgi:hypothetical protein